MKDFHPLLENLFRKMPNVNRVEYTHGNSEMGADFVLSMNHSVLNTERFIGVIVKVGKITQDTSDVEKQVRECSIIPRYFENGKKEISLDEIWVISNGAISNNAKSVIKNTAQLRSIEFITGKDVIDLIDSYLPLYWSNLPVHTSEYITSIREKTVRYERNTSLLHLGDNDFYVEQDIYEVIDPKVDREKSLQSKPKKINIFEKLKAQKINFIEGRMGTGKSRLLRQIVTHFSTPEIYKDKKLLPILIDYKAFYDRYDGDISKLLDDLIPQQLKDEFDDEVQILLLIDGVDERKLTVEEEVEKLGVLLDKIQQMPKMKVVIASRIMSNVGIAADQSQNIGKQKIGRYEIRSLSFSKVLEFIRNICKGLNLTQRIVEDLRKSQLFRDLPQNPITAILLAKLLDEHSKELPSNMTELYSKYTELVLGKWDMDKGLQSDREYQTLNTFFMNLSEYMIENEISQISIEEARERLNDYLSIRNLGIDTDQLLKKILTRCEILATDYEKNVIFFKHRTFAEFLMAKKVIEKNKLVIDDRIYTSYWRNVFYFCVGILKDCPEVLKEITDFPINSESERISKLANLPNFYLAGFATEYEIISKGIEKMAMDTAKL